MTIEDYETILIKALKQFPNLSEFGFHGIEPPVNVGFKKLSEYHRSKAALFSEDFAEQVDYSKKYFEAHPYEIKTKKISSYGLKHDVERWADIEGQRQHITNGALIIAAIAKGYKVVQNGSSPNASINRK